MQMSYGRGGNPQIHVKGKRIASNDIARNLHPHSPDGWVARLQACRATRVRAELQAAVQKGVLDYDEAEWVYQILRVGKGWYCMTLDAGRGWTMLHHPIDRTDDPTIPKWWFER